MNRHAEKTCFSANKDARPSVGLILFLISFITVFSALIPGEASAQVRFNLSLAEEGAELRAESFDFNRDARRTLTTDELGRITGIESAACLRISAAENISVLVQVQFRDVQLPGGSRPVTTEARYLNDGGACPELPAIARELGRPLDAQGRAAFTLDQRPRIASRLPGSPQRLSAWLILLADLRLNPDATPLQRAFTDQYEGEFTIKIEYL
ncbi:MAG: hypothetical protein JJU35_15155 [Balneolales bacterium]|nr:hypothetical protein [Balneolales bacterium]